MNGMNLRTIGTSMTHVMITQATIINFFCSKTSQSEERVGDGVRLMIEVKKLTGAR